MNRWERLERYSRWKQARLRIDLLPNDVMLNILGFLIHEDVCTLLNALYAVPRQELKRRHEAQRVPSELRAEWLHGAACDGVRRMLYSLGEIALYHARDCSRVCVYANWSVFSGPYMPMSLCTYEWTHLRTATVIVDDPEVRGLVERVSVTGQNAVSLALYRYLWWGGNWVLNPDPCYRTTYAVFPYFLASESRYSGWSWMERNARIGDSNSPRVLASCNGK